MKGKIGIEKLRLPCEIGCLSQEIGRKQEIIITLEVTCDFKALESVQSSVDQTLDYRSLVSLCEEITSSPCILLESLAINLVESIHKKFSAVEAISLKITKPHAFMQQARPYVSLSWER